MNFLYSQVAFVVSRIDGPGTSVPSRPLGPFAGQGGQAVRAGVLQDSKVTVTLTDKAAEQLKAIMKSEVENKNLKADAALRLMVVGGGCAGFSYKMGFDEAIKEDDRTKEIKGVKVIVDEKSNLYLEGVEIDFHDGLMGKGFVFNNPNASGTCGCGESFSV